MIDDNIVNETAVDCSGIETANMESGFAIVTSPLGFLMKLQLTAPSIDVTFKTKPLPSIDNDFSCSEYRMQFPIGEEPVQLDDIKLFTETRSNISSSRNKSRKKSPNPTFDENSENRPPASQISNVPEKGIIVANPLSGRTRPIRKRKIVEELKDNLTEVQGQVAPKFTRSVAKKIKLEPISEYEPTNFTNSTKNTITNQKNGPRTSRSRSTSQTKSSDGSTSTSTKGSKRSKKITVVDLPLVLEFSENSNIGIPNETYMDYKGDNEMQSLLRDLPGSQQNNMVPTFNNYSNSNFAFQGTCSSVYQPHHSYNNQMAYQGAPFIPLPMPTVQTNPFFNMPFQVPVMPFCMPYHPININLAMAFQGFPFFPIPVFHGNPNIGHPVNHIAGALHFQSFNDDIQNTTQVYQEATIATGSDYNIKNELTKEVSILTTGVESEAGPSPTAVSSDQNTINRDFFDPLDFDLTEDVTELDLMSIIDEGIEYGASIYDCNPLNNFILMENPQLQNGNSSNLNTPPKQRCQQWAPINNKEQEILIPLYPTFQPDDINWSFEDEMLPSSQPIAFECPRCLNRLDMLSVRYHNEVTCKELPIQIAMSA